MSAQHECVDCRALPERPAGPHPDGEYRPARPRKAPHGGPRSRRCTTHHRRHRAAQRARQREQTARLRFGLAPGERAALLAFQDGQCPICGRGLDADQRGRWRRTATDHDHACCDGPTSCGECVRGLTCGWCNTELLPRIDLAAARRLVAYYEDPPARRMRAGLPA